MHRKTLSAMTAVLAVSASGQVGYNASLPDDPRPAPFGRTASGATRRISRKAGSNKNRSGEKVPGESKAARRLRRRALRA